MVSSILLLGLASLVASGVLFAHQRALTYLAAAGVLWEGQWLLLTLLDRTVLEGVETRVVFDSGALILLAIWLLFYRRWSFPYISGAGSGRRDLAVLAVLFVVLTAAWLVINANGFLDGAWVTHGFYNGDTTTFIALVQRSLLTAGLVDTNPFAGGGALEYPTLLHAGVASVLTAVGISGSWLYFLPAMTLLQIIITVPLFFLLMDVVFPEPNEPWKRWFGVPSRLVILAGQAGLVLFVLALAWDNYVYPQSHFFLTGLFLLQVALLIRRRVVPASAVALVLMLANAVTGAAAVAVLAIFYWLQAADRKQEVTQRFGYLGGVVLWVIVFLLFAPGEAAWGWPTFSYTAAPAMIRLGPILVALLAAVWLKLDKQQFLSAAVAVLAAMGFVVFFFSTRNIVIENAERFFYHALVIGFPLLLSLLIRLFYWLRRQLIDTDRPLGQVVAGWLAAVALLLATLLPAGASVASAHDNLMFKDKRVVTITQREALDWLAENTGINAIILSSPNPPWAVPIFAGRALLRADYWLSPQDELARQVTAAFAGDRAAQEMILNQADYLLLPQNEQELWDVSAYDQVFSNTAVNIYRLR